MFFIPASIFLAVVSAADIEARITVASPNLTPMSSKMAALAMLSITSKCILDSIPSRCSAKILVQRFVNSIPVMESSIATDEYGTIPASHYTSLVNKLRSEDLSQDNLVLRSLYVKTQFQQHFHYNAGTGEGSEQMPDLERILAASSMPWSRIPVVDSKYFIPDLKVHKAPCQVPVLSLNCFPLGPQHPTTVSNAFEIWYYAAYECQNIQRRDFRWFESLPGFLVIDTAEVSRFMKPSSTFDIGIHSETNLDNPLYPPQEAELTYHNYELVSIVAREKNGTGYIVLRKSGKQWFSLHHLVKSTEDVSELANQLIAGECLHYDVSCMITQRMSMLKNGIKCG